MTERELVLANKVSGSLHGGVSRIRLSLAFRIALHYCFQLVQEFYSRCADSDRCFLLLHRDTRFRGAEGNAAASGNADGGNPGGTG